MNPLFKTLMSDVTRLTLAGDLGSATAAIQEAMGRINQAPVAASSASPAKNDDWVIDVEAREVVDQHAAPDVTQAPPRARVNEADQFLRGTHADAVGSRDYKLYVPPNAQAGQALPLVVMLHGCTQNPDDFAAGTAMNERAAGQGFFVLYPAQAQDANPSRCWNWFKHNHQQRGRGEPALIADLVQTLVKQYGMDSSRIYIAGLSAGGAMAAIVAEAYPDVFAAVGIHSGLPQGSASNVAEALAVMKSGAPSSMGHRGRSARMGSTLPAATHSHSPVPTIVFHGDQDQTVHPRNGEQVITHVVANEATTGFDDRCAQVEHGASPGGRRYTRSIHQDRNGRVLAEHWLVHGAGHAWSGGRAGGSYTDPTGPDATREMLRFFLAQSRSAKH